MAKQALGLKLPIKLGQDGYFDTNTTTIGQVSANIRNLLMTKPGERRFNNEFGSSLYELLFQQNELEVNPGILPWLRGLIFCLIRFLFHLPYSQITSHYHFQWKLKLLLFFSSIRIENYYIKNY